MPTTTPALVVPTTAPYEPEPTTPAPTAPESTPSETSVPETTTTLVEASRYPDQPDGVPWPTAEWPQAELPAGVDKAVIDAAADTAFGADDAAARMRSIVVVHGGSIVYERYHPLDSADTIFSSFSVAKSVTSALIGMFVDDGVFDVDRPAPVPEWQSADDPRHEITLEQLLQMRSGLSWTEAYGADDPAGQMFASADWAQWVIDQPLEAEPGEQFDYSTGTTAVLAEIMADELGGPEQLTTFIETELLDPLGMQSTTLTKDPTGQFVGGLGFDNTARDFARFGYLFLRGGEWDGEQLLSEDWIDYSATPSPANPQYGAQWWLYGPPNTMLASGLFGQQILVAPELDLVIVVTSTAGGAAWPALMAAYDQFAALA